MLPALTGIFASRPHPPYFLLIYGNVGAFTNVPQTPQNAGFNLDGGGTYAISNVSQTPQSVTFTFTS